MKKDYLRFVVQVPLTDKNAEVAHKFARNLMPLSEQFEGEKIIKCESINLCAFHIGNVPAKDDFSI